MKKTTEDWAKIAKDGASKVTSGFVYVGHGGDPQLADIFGPQAVTLLAGDTFRNGCVESNEYKVSVDAWEKVTGLNYQEVISGEKTKVTPPGPGEHLVTENRPGLFEFVKGILAEKGITVHGAYEEGNYLKFSNKPYNGQDIQMWVNNTLFKADREQLLSYADFISRIGALPEKLKETVLKIGSLDVKISAAGIVAGCQSYDPKRIEEIVAWVTESRRTRVLKSHAFKDLEIEPKREIYVDGTTISFSNFDKIVEEYNKFKA